MSLHLLRVSLLALTLVLACAADTRWRRIPNYLTFSVIAVALVLGIAAEGKVGLYTALSGIGMASLALLAYAARMVGSGDVKLLWAIGALTGPRFAGATLVLGALAGGLLGLVWVARRCKTPLPYAYAISLGAALAGCLLQWEMGT